MSDTSWIVCDKCAGLPYTECWKKGKCLHPETNVFSPGWADQHIAKLKAGETVQFRPLGGSMSPKIESGDFVTVIPAARDPIVGDIVLCRINGMQFLHFVKAVGSQGYQIGNNHGRINGWTSRNNIYGIVSQINAKLCH
jgi:hypothetical protein